MSKRGERSRDRNCEGRHEREHLGLVTTNVSSNVPQHFGLDFAAVSEHYPCDLALALKESDVEKYPLLTEGP